MPMSALHPSLTHPQPPLQCLAKIAEKRGGKRGIWPGGGEGGAWEIDRAHQSIPLFLFLLLPRAAGCDRGLWMHLCMVDFLAYSCKTATHAIISKNWYFFSIEKNLFFRQSFPLLIWALICCVKPFFAALTLHRAKKGWPLLFSNILHPYIYIQ